MPRVNTLTESEKRKRCQDTRRASAKKLKELLVYETLRGAKTHVGPQQRSLRSY